MPAQILTLEQTEELEREVRALLVRADSLSAILDATVIASAAAYGNVPPSAEKLGSYANVNNDVASRVLDLVRGAVQTKKEI